MGKHNKTIFFLILVLAFSLRFYGINWDKGFHLHPDERMIIMVAERIKLPQPFTLNNILNPQSSLNPNFFAYGSFPLYLLKTTGVIVSKITNDPAFSQYNGLLYVGRSLSVLFDLLTVFLVYKICQLCLARRPLARLAAFLYAVSVLPIQASHFYAVDIALTALSTLTLYRLLLFLKKPSKINAVLVGTALGLALATKITIVLLLAPLFLTLLLVYLKTKSLKNTAVSIFLIFTFTFLLFTLTMPFALLDFSQFKAQILEQLKMNSNPYIFPFTLQYVDTLPYLYYLKNIFLWGLGIPLSLFAFGGTIFITYKQIKRAYYKICYSSSPPAGGSRSFQSSSRPRRDVGTRTICSTHIIILLVFFWVYFLVVGKSAVKFMRYLLPLYPLLAIFSAYLLHVIYTKIQIKINSKLLFLIFNFSFLIFLIWPLSFIRIYQKNTTRLSASYWINQKIPINSTLGVEHWDDGIPLLGGQNYLFNELTLYDQDTNNKWHVLSDKIAKTDYLILASNRLYVPLPKLTDCQKHQNHCYPYTANYYQELFAEKLGFKLEAVFTSYPTIPFLNLQIIDNSADESFTVYDHPKILIFRNETRLTKEQLFKLITNNN